MLSVYGRDNNTDHTEASNNHQIRGAPPAGSWKNKKGHNLEVG